MAISALPGKGPRADQSSSYERKQSSGPQMNCGSNWSWWRRRVVGQECCAKHLGDQDHVNNSEPDQPQE